MAKTGEGKWQKQVKPEKSQSETGFMAGMIFYLVGIFVIIAVFGVVGMIRTSKQNSRKFIEDISGSLEEAKYFFRESEGWDIERKTEDDISVFSVKTAEGVQYIFMESYGEDRISRIEQEVSKKEDSRTVRGTLSISCSDWNFREVIDVSVSSEERGHISIMYGIPEFDRIDNWGDPGEAERKLLQWVSMDKIRADWEYAEVVMQKLRRYVDSE